MTLPSSGTISLSQLQTEFGGSNPISLSEYYRNGGLTTSNNTGVPTSGTISLSHFYSATAADYSLNAISWGNISWSTTGASGSGSNSQQTISGINQTVTLRMAVSSYSGNIETPTLYVYRSGSVLLGSITPANGAYVDFTVSNGHAIYFTTDGFTSAGTKSNSFTVSITNQSTGGTSVASFTVGGTVDSDNNYYDYTPDAIDWANLSNSSNSETVSAGAGVYQYFSGINAPITVRVAISSRSGSLEGAAMDLYKSGSYYATINATNGEYADTTITNGQGLGWIAYGSTSSGTKTGSWTVTVTNVTTGATLDTFTVNLTADADNNYNVGDYIPNAVDWGNINETGTFGSAFGSNTNQTIAGINQTITLNISTSNWAASHSGEGVNSNVTLAVYKNDVFYDAIGFSPFDTGAVTGTGTGSMNISVSNGDTVNFLASIDVTTETGSGSATSAATFSVKNASSGNTQLDTFTINLTAAV